MSEDNAPLSRTDLGRWIVFAALLVVSLLAYFAFSPLVPPAIHPVVARDEP
jgi:hypothetical protein